MPPVVRRSSLMRSAITAAGLYGFLRAPVIGGIKRTRVLTTFYDFWCDHIGNISAGNKESLFPLIAAARLRGVTLPAPLEHFKP